MDQRTHGQSTVAEEDTERKYWDGDSGQKRAPEREPPSEASTTTVVPFKQRDVPAGDWIIHGLSYDQELDGQTHEEVERDLEQFLDRVESTVKIDGEPVQTPDQYWGDPEQCEDDRWTVEWQYATPPKPVGTEHTFELTWDFDPPFEPFEGDDTFDRIETPGSTYTIVDSE